MGDTQRVKDTNQGIKAPIQYLTRAPQQATLKRESRQAYLFPLTKVRQAYITGHLRDRYRTGQKEIREPGASAVHIITPSGKANRYPFDRMNAKSENAFFDTLKQSIELSAT